MFGRRLLGAITLAACLAAGPQVAGAATKTCTDPSADWQRAKPTDLGLDTDKLQSALKFGDSRLSQSVLLIRHGCLAGVSPNGQMNYYSPAESWSMAKSMVSMAAQRAMTMGLLSPDDRLGALLPEADLAHGDITIRNLLEMNSGLHWDLLGDYGNVFNPDVITTGLHLGFDSSAGDQFEYHQVGVVLLTEAIERAAGRPFKDFIQDELFGPIGIKRSSWTWATDNTGTTVGFYGLQMPAPNFARLGQLMLRQGSWNGRRLIDPAYVAAAHAKSPTNPGYGWLFWRNDPDGYVGSTITKRNVHTEPNMPALPMDTYQMSGLLNQEVVIIPSLDTVYVRLGLPDSDLSKPDFDFVDWIGAGEGSYNISRRLMQSFISPKVPDPGPYPDEPKQPTDGLVLHPEELIPVLAEYKQPLPPAGPARARVPITTGGTLGVDSNGKLILPFSCPAVSQLSCRASFVLTTAGGRPLSSAARSTVKKGEAGTVTLRLTATTRRRLAASSDGRLFARVSTFVGDDVGRWSSQAIPPVTLALRGAD